MVLELGTADPVCLPACRPHPQSGLLFALCSPLVSFPRFVCSPPPPPPPHLPVRAGSRFPWTRTQRVSHLIGMHSSPSPRASGSNAYQITDVLFFRGGVFFFLVFFFELRFLPPQRRDVLITQASVLLINDVQFVLQLLRPHRETFEENVWKKPQTKEESPHSVEHESAPRDRQSFLSRREMSQKAFCRQRVLLLNYLPTNAWGKHTNLHSIKSKDSFFPSLLYFLFFRKRLCGPVGEAFIRHLFLKLVREFCRA